ncbi:peptidylprolyl isomerase [Paenimyroides tangerinum]|uniref:Peptidylprolyl isomerase n=1 Tax=Paenimyroides tangerinum TaxID=2488728 RepID=A0A3P3WBX2_9FLAO|nr:peptidylprolyl isomerase [Paenimyroides tangerinum]RRJ90113.1 peptidylprolyl isomerase [Paenimyroides tangerinum]
MNLKSLVYFSLFGFVSFNGNAQNASDELLKINGVPFTVGEFERIYTKNLDLIKDDQQKNIENYLDLFVLYKLKVAKAYDLGLDKRAAHINEFDSHRKQLAEQYLTNEETLERLAKEAYERSLYEIKASHIIVLADEFVTPADSLKAYNKAMDIRNQIVNGKDFGEAAVEFSEDPSAKTNKGDLGYFSVLRMVYPFETGAYNTPVGQVSMPIRSQFGYHLIKVDDKRLRRGKQTVAQIFIQNKEDVALVDPNKLIMDDIYAKLQNGEKFEDLVMQFSDDTTSKANGGKFGNYDPGVISIDNLDDEVYKLKKAEDYSKPFKSQHGWHIVKLVSEEKIPTFDERKFFYKQKVQSDSRSRIINEQLVAHLKKKYNYKENNKNYSGFVKFVEKNVTKPEYLKGLKTNNELAKFADQKISEKDFSEFITKKGVNFAAITPIVNGIDHVYNDFVSEKILDYYNNNLENEFPEFKNTTKEFKEGLLLFDLMETEIWQKVKNDTLGYTDFYKTNLNKFYQNEAINGTVYEAEKKADIKKAQKFISKNLGKKPEEINGMLDVNLLVSRKGKFEKNNKNLPQNYVLREGVSEIFEQDGKYYFVVADAYFPEKTLELEDAKQNVIYEYQQVFENQWINDLKENAKIEINKPILNQLKSKYKQN